MTTDIKSPSKTKESSGAKAKEEKEEKPSTRRRVEKTKTMPVVDDNMDFSSVLDKVMAMFRERDRRERTLSPS